MNIEAMKQALEALELLRSGLIQMRRHAEEYGRAWAGAYVKEYQELLSGSAMEQFRILNALQDRLADVDEAVVDGYQAIASLRLAIAEAEKKDFYWHAIEGILDEYGLQAIDFVADFKAALKAAETEKQEPVAWMESYHEHISLWKDACHTIPLYTHPPKREWVSLTDEDMRLCLAAADYNQAQYKRTQYWAHLATAIDAKLREKNGG
jgi:hypothetical protein